METLPVADIEANDYNPNVVPEDLMGTLKNSIVKDGIQQPVIVNAPTEEGGKHVIIDGEHRWRVAVELGLETVPVTLKTLNREEAMVMTIAMNKLRGEFDTIKLAGVLGELRRTYSDAQLEEFLGYNPQELQSYEDIVDFDLEGLKDESDAIAELSDEVTDDSIALTNEFTITVTLEQLMLIESAIECAESDDKSVALASICGRYLAENHATRYEEVKEKCVELKEAENPDL